MKLSVRWAIGPPLVFGFVGAVVCAGFCAACALALGYYNPVTAAIFGFSLGLGGTFYFGLLLWLGWINPKPEPVTTTQPQQPEYQPTSATGSTLRRDPIESIHRDKAVKVAEKIRHGATVSHGGLGSILDRIEISNLQAELIDKNMALPRGKDHRGGIELTDKGLEALDSYLPHQSFQVWSKSRSSAYTHTPTHSNYVS